MTPESGDGPKLLYHYTDAPGLLGILASKTLWATHARYLNDSRELDHGVDVLRDILERYVGLLASQSSAMDGATRTRNAPCRVMLHHAGAILAIGFTVACSGPPYRAPSASNDATGSGRITRSHVDVQVAYMTSTPHLEGLRIDLVTGERALQIEGGDLAYDPDANWRTKTLSLLAPDSLGVHVAVIDRDRAQGRTDTIAALHSRVAIVPGHGYRLFVTIGPWRPLGWMNDIVRAVPLMPRVGGVERDSLFLSWGSYGLSGPG